jgi:hypothetical protein
MPQRTFLEDILSFPIRPSVRQRVRHAPERITMMSFYRLSNDSCNAAHLPSILFATGYHALLVVLSAGERSPATRHGEFPSAAGRVSR